MTSRYDGSTISGRQQNQRLRRRQGERHILTNNNFARVSRFFVHFFAVVAPFHEPDLWSWPEHNTKVVAFFLIYRFSQG